jgi:hypothetical protein
MFHAHVLRYGVREVEETFFSDFSGRTNNRLKLSIELDTGGRIARHCEILFDGSNCLDVTTLRCIRVQIDLGGPVLIVERIPPKVQFV